MSVLREIVAKYYVEVDDKPLTKLDRQIANVNKRLMSIGSAVAVGFAAAAYASFNFVQLASGVEETMNVLQVTFGPKGAQDIVGWAKVTGDAMSRSQYDLQKYASTFGAFLSPQLAGTGMDVQAMSQKLTELSVDLASFFNLASDEEAMMKLRSGLAGETEAVRSLGIDLSDTGLSEFNRQTKMVGGGKKTQSLTMPEKLALRYAKILKDTANAQGDAERTQASWANQLKSFKAILHETGVEIGQALIEPAKWLLKKTKDVISFIRSLKDNLEVLGVIAAGFAGRLLYVNAQLAIMALATPGVIARLWEVAAAFTAVAAPAALFVGLALALEDLYHFMQGNESVLEHFLRDWMGIEKPLKAANLVLAQMRLNIERVVNGFSLLGSLGKDLVLGKGLSTMKETFNAHVERARGIDRSEEEIAARQRDPNYALNQAVQSGNFEAALNSEHSQGDTEGRRQWMTKYLEGRKEYLSQHPEKRTQWDIEAGTAFQPLLPKEDLSSQKVVPYTHTEGDMTVTFNMTIGKDATEAQAKEAGETAWKSFQQSKENFAKTMQSMSPRKQ